VRPMSRPAKPRTAPTRWEHVPLCLTVEAAARVVGVSGPTLRREAASGALRTVRLGRRVVVTQDALREFLQGEAR
jgi:excisionase family DNA binding protein